MAEEQDAGALDAQAWERRAALCREQIDRIAWLAGSWRGHGLHGGVPRVCEVEARLLFDGSFLEARERIYTPEGALEHEDVTVYGADPDGEQSPYWAMAFIRGGLAVRYTVHVSGDQIVCDPDQFGARLSIARDGDGYRVRIFYPDNRGAWVEDAVVEYAPRE
jgi:hypothetical protein